MNVAERKSHGTSHGWEPISTAPKDKFVLLACPSGYTTTPWVFTTGILHSDYKVGRWVDHANDDLSDWGMSPMFWRGDIITPDSTTTAPAPVVPQGEADGVQREIAAALALFPIDISSHTFRVKGVNSDQPLDADDDTQFFSKKKVMALLQKLYGHLTAAATPAPAPAQEMTQSEPIYQLQRGDGSWIDQDKASYDYNAQYGINTIRIVYTAPAPAQKPETALQKFTRFKVAETEGNPVEMLRAFCAFAMNSQDWFDVEPFFDLVREAMASRTAVAPAQEVGLTDEAVNDAAKVLAERFDYPWEHMPEEGRKIMRAQARAVVKAALRAKGGK